MASQPIADAITQNSMASLRPIPARVIVESRLEPFIACIGAPPTYLSLNSAKISRPILLAHRNHYIARHFFKTIVTHRFVQRFSEKRSNSRAVKNNVIISMN